MSDQTTKERPILFKKEMVTAILEGRKTETRRLVDFTKVFTASQRAMGFEMNIETATAGDLSWLASDKKSARELKLHQQLNVPVRHPADKVMEWADCGRHRLYCPKGAPGDRLWVKEAFTRTHPGLLRSLDPEPDSPEWRTLYRENWEPAGWAGWPKGSFKWTPSIFMKRDYSRITLEILTVRVERLQDITEEGAKAEGVVGEECYPVGSMPGDGRTGWTLYVPAYRRLWNEINLQPAPIEVRDPKTGKRAVVSYRSFPWSLEDFEMAHPGVMATGMFRGRPLVVQPNPWVWVIGFKKLN